MNFSDVVVQQPKELKKIIAEMKSQLIDHGFDFYCLRACLLQEAFLMYQEPHRDINESVRDCYAGLGENICNMVKAKQGEI